LYGELRSELQPEPEYFFPLTIRHNSHSSVTKEGLWRKMNAGPGTTEGRRRIDESSMIQTVRCLNGEAAKTEELKRTEEHPFK
jgi:hypothetical protein